jgi:hypothetical protein
LGDHRASRGDGIDDGKLCRHADLTASTWRSLKTADLRGHEAGGHRMNAADAIRVLSGQGRDDGRAVDAERGKRLQVGLDAGAAGRSEPAMVSAIGVVIARLAGLKVSRQGHVLS